MPGFIHSLTPVCWDACVQAGLCAPIFCKFGADGAAIPGQYYDVDRVWCYTPSVTAESSAVVYVSLDNGKTYLNTTAVFRFSNFPVSGTTLTWW
jgi:hypothetical protein